MTGIEMISQERDEQINKHGYKSDIGNDHIIELVKYLLCEEDDAERENIEEYLDMIGVDTNILDKFNKKSKIEKLTIAGALIAAEIDSLLLIEY